MRAGDLLRQLDQRLLPRLVGAVSRLGQGPARPRVLPTAALLSCAAVLLTAVWATGDRPAGDRTVGDVTRVGVAAGESIPGYVRAAAADLAALPDRRAALKADRPTTLGFGMAVFVSFLIPLGAVLLMPAAVAGAALLTRRVLGQSTEG